MVTENEIWQFFNYPLWVEPMNPAENDFTPFWQIPRLIDAKYIAHFIKHLDRLSFGGKNGFPIYHKGVCVYTPPIN